MPALIPLPWCLQISLTDHRQQSVIDFSALSASGFQMVTITLSAEQHINVRNRGCLLPCHCSACHRLSPLDAAPQLGPAVAGTLRTDA